MALSVPAMLIRKSSEKESTPKTSLNPICTGGPKKTKDYLLLGEQWCRRILANLDSLHATAGADANVEREVSKPRNMIGRDDH